MRHLIPGSGRHRLVVARPPGRGSPVTGRPDARCRPREQRQPANWGDTSRRPDGSSSARFDADGRYGDPVYAGSVNDTAGDFWPGFYSRTHVGPRSRGYQALMSGMRAGRMWVDHGRLVRSFDVTIRSRGRGRGRGGVATLGDTLQPRRGERLELVVRVTAQDVPNWAQFVPTLNRLDLVRGDVVASSASDRDTFLAPGTKVVRQWDTSGRTGTFEIRRDLGRAEEPFYLRLRGTDANRSQPGFLGRGSTRPGP